MTEALWETYAATVELSGGYRNTTVQELLAVAGKKAAGARIVETIEQELAAQNIGHFPPKIPRDQTARVLLYNQARPGLGTILHMVRQLSEGHASVEDSNRRIVGLSMLLDAIQERSSKDAAST